MEFQNGLTAAEFKSWEGRAKQMSLEALEYSIRDCQACLVNHINENKYIDQISVFRQEIDRRAKKGKKS